MKKFLIAFCSLMSVICLSHFIGCNILKNKQSNLNPNETTNDKRFSQDCPISLTEKSVILNNLYMQLMFENNSNKKIIAYEAIFILYNVYGEKLTYNWNTSPYNKIAESPSRFESGSTDLHYYSINSKAYYSQVYIYYVLFDDQTDWGCRINIPVEQVVELGTKYKIER